MRKVPCSHSHAVSEISARKRPRRPPTRRARAFCSSAVGSFQKLCGRGGGGGVRAGTVGAGTTGGGLGAGMSGPSVNGTRGNVPLGNQSCRRPLPTRPAWAFGGADAAAPFGSCAGWTSRPAGAGAAMAIGGLLSQGPAAHPFLRRPVLPSIGPKLLTLRAAVVVCRAAERCRIRVSRGLPRRRSSVLPGRALCPRRRAAWCPRTAACPSPAASFSSLMTPTSTTAAKEQRPSFSNKQTLS